MGLNLNTVKVLFEIRAAGVGFRKMLTLGRQSFSCHPRVFVELATRYGYAKAGTDWSWVAARRPQYAERFFKLLGADEISAMDISDYEGADLLHDMNEPIPDEHQERYDVVLDGGALEHVFEFPTAIRNCMRMVRTGGSLILITPINNYCGHGLYQFSPELFFRILTERNGFEVDRAVAWEECSRPVFYAVQDPNEVRQRVEITSRYPVLMAVQARKTRHCDRLSPLQQSDYCRLWEGQAAHVPPTPPPQSGKLTVVRKRVLRFLYEYFPRLAKPLFFLHWQRYLCTHSLRQRPGFRRLGDLRDRFPQVH